MGFLDDAPDNGPATPPVEEKKYDGFLSDNPPPPQKEKPPVPVNLSWGDAAWHGAVNAPESAVKYGKDIWHGVSHPVDTLSNLGGLYMGLMQKAGLMPTPESEQAAGRGNGEGGDYRPMPEAVGKMLVDRYGSVDKVKHTMATDPVGMLGDASTILYPMGGAAAKVPYLGKALSTTAKVADPLTYPTLALKGAGKGAAAAFGYETGTGMRPVEEAAKAGYEGGEAGKTFRAYQEGTKTPEEFVDYAMNAKNNILKERGLNYETGMDPVKNSNQILSFSDIGQAMTDAHKVTQFKGQSLNLSPGVQSALQKADDQIIKWVQLNPADFHTPIGFDALKRSIQSIADSFEKGTPERLAVDKYTRAISNTIKKQVPEYAQVMKDYGEFSDQIRQIEKTFSLPRDERKTVIDTALRKMQSLLRRNVNTNFGQREKLGEVLEANGAPHLKAAIAGMSLSSLEAHGLARLVPIIRSVKLDNLGHVAGHIAMSSPLVVGRAAHSMGRLASPLKYVPPHTLEAARQMGRLQDDGYLQQARGGAIDRARRLARKH